MRDDGWTGFETEMMPHFDAAYRVALSLTRQEADAEDLVQETFLRAFRGFSGYRRGSNARAWLLTILRNTFVNVGRQAKSRPREVPLAGRFPGGGPERLETLVPGPEEHAIRSLERERLLRALATVPEPYRTAVALVDLAELRYAEAAEVLGCPRGTVMSRLHRGRLLLAERLAIDPVAEQAEAQAPAALRPLGGAR